MSTSKDFFTPLAGKTNIEDAATDRFGNPEGSDFDLARDGTFSDASIALLHLFTGEGFDFELPRMALEEKGFAIHRWADVPPPIEEFRDVLAKANQLWVVSQAKRLLGSEHLSAIEKFFRAGYGVYLWGDNEPFYADANIIGRQILGVQMEGNLPGNQVLKPQARPGEPGFVPHLVTTGLNNLYEGVTVATVDDADGLAPILYGSAGNLVASAYDDNGRRAILDGGFTRLYRHWDTAGTARYVKNAAAWLANYDQWGRDRHDARDRATAGLVEAGEESLALRFLVPREGEVTIGAFWDVQAEAEVSVYNPQGTPAERRTVSGTAHRVTVAVRWPGGWTATIRFLSGPRDRYSYVLHSRLE